MKKNIYIEKEEKYEDDKLIFEGEYLNGKRNGKGKEYDRSKLIFEGEYLNDERWKGNLYDENGDIIYELNKENVIVKEYDIFGALLFKGEYLNGKRNGKGKEYYNGKLIFEGEYLNGRRWEGKGYDNLKNIIYELKNGKGLVKEYDYLGKLKFEGEYLNGLKNGKGKEYYNGKLEFEGEYLNGELL